MSKDEWIAANLAVAPALSEAQRQAIRSAVGPAVAAMQRAASPSTELSGTRDRDAVLPAVCAE